MDSKEQLVALSIKYEGRWWEICRALELREEVDTPELEEAIKKLKCKYVTIIDKAYPQYLRTLPQPPFVLFYYGDLELIRKRENNIAVVGSRNASQIGIKNTRSIVKGISKKFNIVSGLALGIDTVAHKSALEAGGRTIAVLGNGIEYCYPSENSELYEELKKNHLVISEYYGRIPPNQFNFPQRNRLIVELSRATIIGEGKRMSGSQMTGNLTINMYNQLMCIPSSNIEDSICNDFIKEGCPPITCPQDVFDILD